MARTDSVGETLGSIAGSDVDYDVIVVGGGAAGLSAAVFLARYGLETLVLARGKAAIRQCAHLENYLGFPGGLSPERFLTLGRAHVEREGGTIREELVTTVERATLPSHETAGIETDARDPDRGGFRVESDGGEYLTRYVLAATAYDGDMLESFTGEIGTEDEYGFVDSEAGRTGVEGLYAAGWMSDETVHQVITTAGHGGRVAIAVARDDLEARYWSELAEIYQDWVVAEDRYAGDEQWYEETREWFEREILIENVPDGVAEAGFEYLCAEFLDRCIAEDERTRRAVEGQRLLLEQLDDDVVRAYADSLGEHNDGNSISQPDSGPTDGTGY
jgi:hypothetical protein